MPNEIITTSPITEVICREAKRFSIDILYSSRPLEKTLDSLSLCIEDMRSASDCVRILQSVSDDLKTRMLELNGVPKTSFATIDVKGFITIHLTIAVPSSINKEKAA